MEKRFDFKEFIENAKKENDKRLERNLKMLQSFGIIRQPDKKANKIIEDIIEKYQKKNDIPAADFFQMLKDRRNINK